MIHTVFRSEEFPPGDRFDQWCEVTERRLQPKRISMQRAGDFHGSIQIVTLGTVGLAQLAYSPLRCSRDPVHVRRRDTNDVQLHLIIRGSVALDVDRRQESATAGDMLIHGSWHPYVFHTRTSGTVVKHLTLNVPKHAVTVAPQHIDLLMGRRLAPDGTGAILASLLKASYNAVSQGAVLTPREATRLGDAASCLVSAIIAHHADANAALPAHTRHEVLVRRIHAFIDAHLADPDLSPQTVADAHHLSVRHLHRLFQQDGTRVSAWIRQQRLERCRMDLIDPRLAGHPIHIIAARWSFTHPADFTRAFRAAYGMAPSDFRAALRAQDE